MLGLLSYLLFLGFVVLVMRMASRGRRDQKSAYAAAATQSTGVH
jgi:hypothetical protein